MKTARFHMINGLTFAALILLYFGYVQYADEPYLWVIPAIFTTFALLNALFFRMLLRANAKSPQRFVTTFTGVVGIKLLTALVVVLLYLVTVKEHILQVVVSLFIAYTLFTIVLIRTVLNTAKPE